MKERLLYTCEFCGGVYESKEEAVHCEVKCIKKLRKKVEYYGNAYGERRVFPDEVVARVKYEGKVYTKKYVNKE